MDFLEKANTLQTQYHSKVEALSNILHEFPSPLHIACSGGVDSRFLAYFSKYYAQIPIKLLHITGIHIDHEETTYIRDWAKKHALELIEIPLNILDIEQIQNNLPMRCYYCKYTSFLAMQKIIDNATLCDGSHADDLFSHRPGMQALKELNIHSPLAEAGINKENIRAIATHMGMENAHQSARPCLLTRFNYNRQLSKEKILAVAKAEHVVHTYFNNYMDKKTLPDFRIREIYPEKYVLHTIKPIDQRHIEALQLCILSEATLRVEYENVTKLSGFFDTLNTL